MRASPPVPSVGPDPDQRSRDTPNASRETAPETIALEGLEVQLEHFDGGYSVCFESHTADADLADLFRGLPDDRCQLPRWGYVIKGSVSFRLAAPRATYGACRGHRPLATRTPADNPPSPPRRRLPPRGRPGEPPAVRGHAPAARGARG